MINKNDIIKLARHTFKRGQGIPDRKPIHPKREWAIGLFLGLCIVVAGAITSAQLFNKYNNVNMMEVLVETGIPQYKQTLVETVLKKYEERRVQYDLIRNAAPVIVPVEVVATTTIITDVEVDEVSTDDNFSEEGAGAEVLIQE